MKRNLLFLTCYVYGSLLYAQHVGIGTPTPASALEIKGTGLGTQQRITDVTSGNSLVLQSGVGNNLKITGYNYLSASGQPLYLSVDGANTFINTNGGNVGIGTTTPTAKLSVYSILNGIEHTDGTRRLSTFLNSSGGWFGTMSNHPLHFYTNNSNQQMTLTQAGQLGVGTTSPLGGYLVDVAGPIRSFGNSTHFVAQTTGGTNSWARFYMRSGIGQTAQSWFIGTSQNYVGNQLYIGDETNNHTRFSIQPNNGPIYMQGNITHDLGSYGIAKAMVYVNGDGAMLRCYNGVTGVTGSGCGITSSNALGGWYNIQFPFDISTRFFSVSVENIGMPVSVSFQRVSSTGLDVVTRLPDGQRTDRPIMVFVY